MVIKKKLEDKKLTLLLEGRLDTSTAPKLEEVIDSSLTGIEKLVMDFTKLEYLSSAGLRIILKAQKVMNSKGVMELCNVKESIMEVFEITGFIDILTIQ